MSHDSTGSEADPAQVGKALGLVGIRDIWRSNILYAGVELGVFDSVNDTPKPADRIADGLGTDPQYMYRLLRPLAHYGVLTEEDNRRFTITPLGELFETDHPQSVSHAVRFFQVTRATGGMVTVIEAKNSG